MNEQHSNNGDQLVTGFETIDQPERTKEPPPMPTLDQFMELVQSENTSVSSSPSAYNVYNKYHKTS